SLPVPRRGPRGRHLVEGRGDGRAAGLERRRGRGPRGEPLASRHRLDARLDRRCGRTAARGGVFAVRAAQARDRTLAAAVMNAPEAPLPIDAVPRAGIPRSEPTRRLEVRGLGHAFALRPVLEEVDLEVGAGEVVALVGPSGCGKTTLLHLCAGLHALRTGRIDSDFERPACVFQQPRLLPWKSAIDNITLGLK